MGIVIIVCIKYIFFYVIIVCIKGGNPITIVCRRYELILKWCERRFVLIINIRICNLFLRGILDKRICKKLREKVKIKDYYD